MLRDSLSFVHHLTYFQCCLTKRLSLSLPALSTESRTVNIADTGGAGGVGDGCGDNKHAKRDDAAYTTGAIKSNVSVPFNVSCMHLPNSLTVFHSSPWQRLLLLMLFSFLTSTSASSSATHRLCSWEFAWPPDLPHRVLSVPGWLALALALTPRPSLTAGSPTLTHQPRPAPPRPPQTLDAQPDPCCPAHHY